MLNEAQFQRIYEEPRLGYRERSFGNLLRMGHCAPAVMQSLVDISAPDKQWLVRFVAGMPAGIGNTGWECGGFTSSLVVLGVRHGLRDVDQGLPVIFDKGHALCQHFRESHDTVFCRDIRANDGRFPSHCIRTIVLSPELFPEAEADNCRGAIPAEARACYRRLCVHMAKHDFHCARAVFERLECPGPEPEELMDAVSAFTGGTLFMGLTCSAFAAGVMALGLIDGEIEDNPLRVLRMLATFAAGGDWADDGLDDFNKSMNRGYRLSEWFVREFGSTQCRAITGCNFSALSGVSKYVDGSCVARCRTIAGRVAEKVQEMLCNC
jgi:C_GCAxxG_C_C family probable redox protein